MSRSRGVIAGGSGLGRSHPESPRSGRCDLTTKDARWCRNRPRSAAGTPFPGLPVGAVARECRASAFESKALRRLRFRMRSKRAAEAAKADSAQGEGCSIACSSDSSAAEVDERRQAQAGRGLVLQAAAHGGLATGGKPPPVKGRRERVGDPQDSTAKGSRRATRQRKVLQVARATRLSRGGGGATSARCPGPATRDFRRRGDGSNRCRASLDGLFGSTARQPCSVRPQRVRSREAPPLRRADPVRKSIGARVLVFDTRVAEVVRSQLVSNPRGCATSPWRNGRRWTAASGNVRMKGCAACGTA
jgi:hypothetical protein